MGYKTGRPPLTREYLLKKLKDASALFGPEITVKEMISLPGFPSKCAFQNHFGGFNQAKSALNLFLNGNSQGGKSGLKRIQRMLISRQEKGKYILPAQRRTAPLKKRFEILARDGFRCVYCGRVPADGARLVVDHVKPFSNGGLTLNTNMVTSCTECNVGKGDILLKSAISQKNPE